MARHTFGLALDVNLAQEECLLMVRHIATDCVLVMFNVLPLNLSFIDRVGCTLKCGLY